MQKLFNKNFILMVQGSAISTLGDILYSVAIGYWVYEKTGSNALLGIMSSISNFMIMFLSPFTGSVTDKVNRKMVIVSMDIARGIIMIVAGALAMSDNLTVGIVLICAFMASLCSVFFDPSVTTVLIDIIPHERMVKGQSIYGGIRSLINLTGKAVSGALVAFFGVGIIIILNGISYLISAMTEMFIDIPKTVQEGNKVTVRAVISDMMTGFKSIFNDRFLKVFIPLALIINLLGAGSMYLMLPFVLNKGFSVDYYGLLMAVETAGSLLSILILGVANFKPDTRYWLMSTGFILAGVFNVVAYISNNGIVMLGMFFMASFMNGLGNAIFNACLILALPDENRGAILGVVQSFSMGGCALSSVIYGILCDMFNIVFVFIGGIIISTVPMVFFCISKNTREFINTH